MQGECVILHQVGRLTANGEMTSLHPYSSFENRKIIWTFDSEHGDNAQKSMIAENQRMGMTRRKQAL